MSELVQVLLVTLLVMAGAWVAVRRLAPALVKRALARELRNYEVLLGRELEDFKATTRAQAEAELELARAEISRGALEQRVRFTRLHEQRVKIIAGAFTRLERLHREICGLTQVIDTGQERPLTYGRAIKAYREFQDFYYERSIWLDRETIALLEPIVDLLVRPLSTLAVVKDHSLDDLRRAIQEARHVVDERVPAARQDLETRFRALLEAGEPDAKARVPAGDSPRALPPAIAERRRLAR